MTDDDLERLLNNWSRWRQGAGRGGSGYAAPSYSLEARGRRASVTMPVIDTDAIAIDDVISKLIFAQRQALHGCYLREVLLAPGERRRAIVKEGQAVPEDLRIPPSFSISQIARRLGSALRTFERRLEQARRTVRDGYSFRNKHIA